MRRPTSAVLLAAAIAGCAAGAAASGLNLGGKTLQTWSETYSVGVGGFVRPGAWGPLSAPRGTRIDGAPLGPGAVVRVTDGDGLTLERPAIFPFDGGHALFQAGRAESKVVVAFESAGAPVWTLRPGEDFTVLAADDRLWAAVDLPPALRRVNEAGEPDPAAAVGPLDQPGKPVRVAAFGAAADLPAVPHGLDTVRVLLLAAADLPGDSGFLREWVAGGGHLVLSLGADGDLPDWVPLTPGGPATLTARGPLERLASAGSGRGGAVLNRLVPVPIRTLDEEEVAAANGRVLASGDGGALVAEVPVGFGRVTVSAASLHAAPLNAWAGLPAFLRELVRPGPVGAAAKEGAGGELAGQVFAALEAASDPDAAGGTTLSPGVVGLWVLALLVAVGPLDYLLVHRVLKAPALTWLTLPFWLLGAAGLAWAAAGEADPTPRRLEIVDFDAAAGRVRGAAWASVPAPASGRVGVRFAPDAAAFPTARNVRLGYAAEPADTFGGLFRGGGAGFAPGGYRIDGPTAAGVPLPERAAKRFRLDWDATAPDAFAAALTGDAGELGGSLSHALPGTLTDFLIVYGGRVYRPDPARAGGDALPPGTTWRADGPGVTRRDLRGFLTQVREVRRRSRDTDAGAFGTADGPDAANVETRLVREKYDARSRDLGVILPVLSFFERAGGTGYTGLSNAELEPLDLSAVTASGRAVLLGRLEAPLTELSVDFGDAAVPGGPVVTYVRAVLPVTAARPEEPAAAPPPADRGPIRLDPDREPAPRPRREPLDLDFGDRGR